MNKALNGPAIVGLVVVALIGLVFVGYRYMSGPKPGEKPPLDPVLNRMYGPHPAGGTPTQGQPGTSGQGQ